MQKVIITGAVGSGKSTVGWIVEELTGDSVFDADEVVHAVLDEPSMRQAFEEQDVFASDGSIDRTKMAVLVFDKNNHQKKELLENLTHPAVYRTLADFWQEKQRAGQEIAFAEIPLLFESDKMREGYDASILVYADDEIRSRRIVERHKLTDEQARQRIEAQTPAWQNLAKADYVIVNNSDQNLLKRQVENVLEQIAIDADVTKVAIYAGSFDPITNGHMEVIEQSLKVFNKIVIVVATSGNKTGGYMFTTKERADIVREATEQYGPKIEVVELADDFVAEYAKRHGIKNLVRGIRSTDDYIFEHDMAIANRIIFPQLDTVLIPSRRNGTEIISSTLIKKEIYGTGNWEEIIRKFVPEATVRALRAKKLRQE
ncbi:pantetheine-phosphate adenylyltransferase [Candidatus Saccharibacteria bacterium]|nr:pantetheine-phosphate adenylyltransferase [Candidatus Saccharibacteria bacterium]